MNIPTWVLMFPLYSYHILRVSYFGVPIFVLVDLACHRSQQLTEAVSGSVVRASSPIFWHEMAPCTVGSGCAGLHRCLTSSKGHKGNTIIYVVLKVIQ